MGRMYGKGKGISASTLPYKRRQPSWIKMKPSEIDEVIVKLAKKGQTPSQIGATLRDTYGIPRVTPITGTKILRILRSHGIATSIPEDLYFLIKKAVSMRKHLEKNKKDKDCKFRLILTESKIHRISRYYKRKKLLPSNWKYQSSTASALIA